jgi:hypothetical protein
MADTTNPTGNPGVPTEHANPNGPNKGQIHGGQQGDQSADLQHNQASAVRSSGDQNPSDTYKSDRDRTDTPGTNPG